MSRVEEELVGSLTCFLIKHSGEKQLCLAIMDKETVLAQRKYLVGKF